jgi:alpha/beta superfamily hydrolase
LITQPASTINSLFLPGPAGELDALLNTGAPNATHAALVCHPHPLYGGTMHNKVVYHAMKALNHFGFPVLRFNFRGAGRSAGVHDGRAESEDVRAALDWLEDEFHLPIIFAGFSFGAAVGLHTCCPDPRVKALISLGTPVAAEGRVYAYKFLQDCQKPKLFVSGTRDQFGPHEEIERIVQLAADPRKLVWIEGADHFFEGKLKEMRAAIEIWVDQMVGE